MDNPLDNFWTTQISFTGPSPKSLYFKAQLFVHNSFRYEQGYRDIPSDILIALADLYGTSTDYILGRTDDPRFSGAKGK